MRIACLDPSPTNAEQYQRLVTGALGLTAKGKNAFKAWRNTLMKATEAFIFDDARVRGIEPSQIYQAIAYAHNTKTSNDGQASELRKRQDRVTKGRRTIKAFKGAQ
jgi:hypothetical protein